MKTFTSSSENVMSLLLYLITFHRWRDQYME